MNTEPAKRVQIACLMDPDKKTELRMAAAKRGISMSSLTEELLLKGLEQLKEPEKPKGKARADRSFGTEPDTFTPYERPF